MKIFVTQDHIKQGEVRSSSRCPVALAIQAAINEEVYVKVHYKYDCDDNIRRYWCVHTESDQVVYLHEIIGKKIATYDKTGQMEPFDFDIL